MRAILFWALLLPIPGFAQENTAVQQQGRPPFIVKTTPLNLGNPIQQSVDILADIPIAPRWGIEIGIGVVVESALFAPYQGESYKGLKFKPAIKYYTKRTASGGNYLSLAFKYNTIQNDRYITVLRQGGQYTELMLQRKHLDIWGAALRMGSQLYLGHRKRWIIEPFLGFGVRQLHATHYALPPDAELVESQGLFSFDRLPGIYTTADFMMGFCLGWIIPTSH